MLAWSISSSGFSTTISKLVAEENSKKEYGNIKRILSICIFISGLISCLLSFLVFIFSGYIANNLLKSKETLLSLHIMCISFPFMAIGSCIRGYFLGMQDAIVPAISQVLEQVSRMITIYILASIFIPMGLSYACAVGVIGMCVGEIFAFLYVLMVYNAKINNGKKPTVSTVKYTSIILAMAIPLTANRVLGSFLSTIENILIPQKLIEYGYNATEAMSLYGQLSGMSMPLVMFPSSLLTALAIAMIPAISEAMAKNKISTIRQTISKTLNITAFIGIGTTGLFIFFSNELGMTIYSQDDIGWQLLYIGFLCPFLYLQVTFSGILNGLGEQFLIFKNSIVSSIINICFIYFLIPKYDLYAFIIGWFLSLIIVNIISISKLKSKIDFKIDISNSVLKPIICILSSGIIAKYCYNLLILTYGEIFSLVISLSILGLIYIILLILVGALNIKEFIILK
ncbi:putative polysaccharide biosynthesis protein [[Clostridium] colinum]|uniref:putative polysaccharide biosynthesis protein n=1 Tax=[Clostridium] colinum TaxID=36835 RepID=UPI002024C53A|nr:polysaccharide biosynthesis protein [[Clostridium] colinum]